MSKPTPPTPSEARRPCFGDDAGLLDIGTRYLGRQIASIGGGTTEMARNVIGERVLNFPREYAADRGVPFNHCRGYSACQLVSQCDGWESCRGQMIVSGAGAAGGSGGERWLELRRFRVLRDAGASISEIARETGLNWRTVKKYLEAEGPAGPPVPRAAGGSAEPGNRRLCPGDRRVAACGGAAEGHGDPRAAGGRVRVHRQLPAGQDVLAGGPAQDRRRAGVYAQRAGPAAPPV